MVAFRKLFPALAGFSLLLGATSAFGQVTGGTGGTATQTTVCTLNSGVTPVVRAEGYTELAGDLVVSCTGGDPAAPFLANFQLFLNTQVTSRLINTTNNLTEALLLIDEPGNAGRPAFCASSGPATNPTGFSGVGGITFDPTITPGQAGGPAVGCLVPQAGTPFQTGSYNAFAGQLGGIGAQAQTSVVWTSIPVVPPGSNRTRTFRITNIRANANGIGVSSTFLPNQVIAFLSVSPSTSLPVPLSQVTLAYVQQGLAFDVRNCANGDAVGSANLFDACVSRGNSAYRPGGTPGSTTTALDAYAALRFREGFASSFKPALAAGQSAASPVGTVYLSESGLIRDVAGATVGTATTGTRLVARFANIPENVRLYVSTTNVGITGGPATGSAQLVSGTDLAGAGGSLTPLSSTTFSIQCTATTPTTSLSGAEVTMTGGTGVAVWEVTSATTSSEDFVFLLGAAFSAATGTGTTGVGLGTGTVQGHFAPFYAVPTTPSGPAIAQSTSAYSVPRFAPSLEPATVFRTAACSTVLMFPYVTNWAGFDTGLAIANTSRDPFSSPNDRLQGGTCTLNYYGRQANGNDPVRANETTNAPVAAGDTITMVLSTGGSLGLQGNANFQGYIIAQCNFLYAHGFAFITDGPIGSARVAEGYLAIVLSGPGQARNLTERGEVRAH